MMNPTLSAACWMRQSTPLVFALQADVERWSASGENCRVEAQSNSKKDGGADQ